MISYTSDNVAVGSPVDFLFNTVPLPMLSQSPGNHDVSLRKYQSSLKQQLLGRTGLLDNVLNALEQCASHIHEEISFIRSSLRSEAKYMMALSYDHPSLTRSLVPLSTCSKHCMNLPQKN